MPDDVRLIRSPAEIALARSDSRLRDAADAECACGFAAAERIATLLDRHPGDAGSDPDALESVTDRLQIIEMEIKALLGRPAQALIRDGRIVGLVRS